MDDSTNSDNQSNGFLSLIGSLGTAYFGAETAQAAANAAAQKAAITTPTPAVTPATQWLPGVSNQNVVLGGAVILLSLVLVISIRSRN